MNGNFDRIESYLLGQMSAIDKESFEKEMATDTLLAEEVALQKAEHRSMQLLLHKELRANLNEWKVEKDALESQGQSGRVVYMRRKVFLLAAAASIVLLVGFFAIQWLNQPDPATMADNLFEETSPTVRGNDASAPALLTTALDKMREKEFAAALQNLQAVNDTAYSEIVLLLKGECYYRLGQYPLAVQSFQQIIQPKATPLNRQKAEWYLLLTYLKSDSESPAFNGLLQKIVGELGHAFNREATELKERL